MTVAAYPRYESYKYSGVAWIGQIPMDWRMLPLRHLSQIHAGNGFPHELQGDDSGTIPFLKVSDFQKDSRFVSSANNMVCNRTVQHRHWNIVPKGCLVTAKIGEALRRNHRNITEIDCIIDNNCIAFEPCSVDRIFFYYLHKVIDFDWFVNPGAVPSISVQKYRSQRVALPHPTEQRAIAAFLDKKCGAIDEAVRIKQAQITLLQERRQILIQQAVTRGLNPHAPRKDSGIDWIGPIPAHWEVKRGKWLFKKMDRAVRPTDEIVTCFRDGEVTLRANRRTDGFTNALKEHGYQGIRKGDLVIHAMDAFAGAIGVSDSDGKSTPVYSACVPRIKNTVDQNFYAYYLRHIALSGLFLAIAKGIRERSTDFRFKDFADLALAVPPLDEQQAVVSYIGKESVAIKSAITIKQSQITALKEYKTVLINAAVTGKIKVAPDEAGGAAEHALGDHA